MNTEKKISPELSDIEVFAHPTNPSKTVYRTDTGMNCPDGYKRMMLSQASNIVMKNYLKK